MGVLLSSFTWLFEPIILVEAFGVTSLIFGVMAFLGYISKGRLAGLWVVMLGLIVGAGILSLFNFLSILFGGISTANVTISWIVSLAIFSFLMLMTMWDVWRIKQIAGNAENSGNNLVYYCAYILYTDFISLLIRVIYYIAILRGRR
jgi:FtsH-binding integral membrane protein